MLSCHVVDNPDPASELALLKAYGSGVPTPLLRRVAALFAELRGLSDSGVLAYPYSTREAVSLVRHLQLFPQDGLLDAAENVFAFDSHQPQLASQAPTSRSYPTPPTTLPQPGV